MRIKWDRDKGLGLTQAERLKGLRDFYYSNVSLKLVDTNRKLLPNEASIPGTTPSKTKVAALFL